MSKPLYDLPRAAIVLRPIFGGKQAKEVFIRKGFEDIQAIKAMAFSSTNRVIKDVFLNEKIDFREKLLRIENVKNSEPGTGDRHEGSGKPIQFNEEIMWYPSEARAASMVAGHLKDCRTWLDEYRTSAAPRPPLFHISQNYNSLIKTDNFVPEYMRRALWESIILYRLVRVQHQVLCGVFVPGDVALGGRPFRC